MRLKRIFKFMSQVPDILERCAEVVVEEPFSIKCKDSEDFMKVLFWEMERGKLVLPEETYVPDRYTISVSRKLYDKYSGGIRQKLCEQLESEMQKQIKRWGYRISNPVKVELAEGKGDDVKAVGVKCKITQSSAEKVKKESPSKYKIVDSEYPLEHFNRGIALQRQGRFEGAAEEFLAVLRLNNRSACAHFNLATIRYRQYRYEEAIAHYAAGLEIEPTKTVAHLDVGKTYEIVGEWDKALYHLNKALELEPNNQTALRRTQRVTEEKQLYSSLLSEIYLDLELVGEPEDFDITKLEHFDVRFAENMDCEKIRKPICHLLENVYLELGRDFDCYPARKIEVFVLYSSNQILKSGDDSVNIATSKMPQWAAGIYNAGITLLSRSQKRVNLSLFYVVLRHEYTHLLVDRLTKGRCPAWLAEGLAELKARCFLDTEWQMLRRVISTGNGIPLKQLERNFNRFDRTEARLAYIESRAVVEFMVDNYGMEKIKRLLYYLGTGKSFNKSLISTLGVGYKELESQWLDWVVDTNCCPGKQM